MTDYPDGKKPGDLVEWTDSELEELQTIRPDLKKEIACEVKRRASI